MQLRRREVRLRITTADGGAPRTAWPTMRRAAGGLQHRDRSSGQLPLSCGHDPARAEVAQMRSHPVVSIAILVMALPLSTGCASHKGIGAGSAAEDASAMQSARQPLLLQDGEGERRLHRPPPGALSNLTAPFIIKVDRRNGGAPELVMFTEDIAPGQAIPPHHHPHADEILFVFGGTGYAVVGGRSDTVRAGATIYMPRNTSVRLKNTGTAPLRIAALFSQPGYEEYMRDISVPEGTPAQPLSVEELTAIRARHRAHVAYEQP